MRRLWMVASICPFGDFGPWLFVLYSQTRRRANPKSLDYKERNTPVQFVFPDILILVIPIRAEISNISSAVRSGEKMGQGLWLYGNGQAFWEWGWKRQTQHYKTTLFGFQITCWTLQNLADHRFISMATGNGSL